MGASAEAVAHRGGRRRRSPRRGAWSGRSRASAASGTPLPFLAASLIGFVVAGRRCSTTQVFHLDERQRGLRRRRRRAGAAPRPDRSAPGSAPRLMAKGPGEVLRFLSLRGVRRVGRCRSSSRSRRTWRSPSSRTRSSPPAWPCSRPGILAALSLAIPPRARVDRVLRRVAVGHPGPARSCRSSARSATTSASASGMLADDAGVPDRRPHDRRRAGDVIADDIDAGVDGRRRPGPRSLYERRQGRSKLLLVRGPRRRLRRGAGAVRRRPRGRRGRDRRAARHERRGQVDAAQGDLRASSRPTAARSSSTAATSPTRRRTRSPALRHRAGARRRAACSRR